MGDAARQLVAAHTFENQVDEFLALYRSITRK